MLVELRLENYAVVDNLVVEFAPGLNLLTGETGAGKSILIDALALLLGDKASADVIRSGADKATISAVFEVESGAEKTVAQILENNGIDQEDESIILRREIDDRRKRPGVRQQSTSDSRSAAPTRTVPGHDPRAERIAPVIRVPSRVCVCLTRTPMLRPTPLRKLFSNGRAYEPASPS